MKNEFPILGIEGGGTKTTWCLLGENEKVLRAGKLGPGNVTLLTDGQLERLFLDIKKDLPALPNSIGAGMAGVVGEKQQRRVSGILQKTFESASRLVVDHDARAGFWSAFPDGNGILVISGTGSYILGRAHGQWTKAGGWGHIAGDAGSAYHLAQIALRAVLSHYDETQEVIGLGHSFLAHSCQNTLEDLICWVMQSVGSKDVVARLAPCVISAAEAGCPVALRCIYEAALLLAREVEWVQGRLNQRQMKVGLSGGLLINSKLYRETFSELVMKLVPSSTLFSSTTPGEIGAARLVRNVGLGGKVTESARVLALADVESSSTEQRNLKTRHLEKRSKAELVKAFLEESSRVVPALQSVESQLVHMVEVVTDSLSSGGRLIYTGAGTSGRLGVLDASEVSPTFGVPVETIQGVMAGGLWALAVGVEDVEDDRQAGADAIRLRGVGPKDVVIGIAASGRTPFVIAGLEEAARLGARTGFLTCNPNHPPLSVKLSAEVNIPTGAEFVTGSTRLNAGTATKIALNLISTLTMVRLGKVKDHFMIDVTATNLKLQNRAVRMVMELTGCDFDTARGKLEKNEWKVRQTVNHES